VIKNKVPVDLTNIRWEVNMTGGVIFFERNKNGSIANLQSNSTTKIRDIPFGLCYHKKGTVIVIVNFFVISVKRYFTMVGPFIFLGNQQ
jgi:hypothetical protein